MKEPQAVHTLLEPLKKKLAMHSPTSTTQTGNGQESLNQGDSQEQQNRILVNMLFARFKAIYTHKFASAYSTPDEVKLAKREWSIAIKGFQEPLLAYAVERAKETYAWPPTISEFLNLINTAYKGIWSDKPEKCIYGSMSLSYESARVSLESPSYLFCGIESGVVFPKDRGRE